MPAIRHALVLFPRGLMVVGARWFTIVQPSSCREPVMVLPAVFLLFEVQESCACVGHLADRPDEK